MKENKDKQINVRVNESHIEALNQIVQDGKAKSVSGALVYLVNQHTILNSKK